MHFLEYPATHLGVAEQATVDGQYGDDDQAEEMLLHGLNIYAVRSDMITSHYFSVRQNKNDDLLPRSVKQAVHIKQWCGAIDRTCNALRRKRTSDYVLPQRQIHPIPFTGVFRLKPIDIDSGLFLHKAGCVVPENVQDPGVNYDPNSLYAPASCHEAIRMHPGPAATNNFLAEEGDISNACL